MENSLHEEKIPTKTSFKFNHLEQPATNLF